EVTRGDEKRISDDERLRKPEPRQYVREFGERTASNRHQTRGRDHRCHVSLQHAPTQWDRTAPGMKDPEIIRQNRSADKGSWRFSSRAASGADPAAADTPGSPRSTTAQGRRRAPP